MKALFLTTINYKKIHGGGTHYTKNMIHLIKGEYQNLEIVVLRDQRFDILAFLKGLIRFMDIRLAYYYGHALEIELENFDKIYCDHIEATVKLTSVLKSTCLIAHNVEFNLKKIFGFVNPFLKKYEIMIAKNVASIICISDADSKYFSTKAKKVNIVHPFFLEQNKTFKNKLGSNEMLKIGFVGAKKFTPNREGLMWFMNNVYSYLERPFKLSILGRGWNFKALNVQNIEYIAEMRDFYDNQDIIIIPLFKGSGMSIKFSEAVYFKKNVLATSLGARGISKKDLNKIGIQTHETAESWIKYLNNFNEDPQASYQDIFTEKQANEMFLQTLKN